MITKVPSLLQKLVQKYLKRFFLANGRAPGTRREWMDIQDDAVRELNKTKGVPKKEVPPFQGGDPKSGIEELLEGPVRIKGPKGDRIWDFSKRGEVIDFPDKGIRSLLKSGDVKIGKTPKTTEKILKSKKDRGILLRDAEDEIARMKRENKQALEDFKKKFKPDDLASGGIARLGFGKGKLVKGFFEFVEGLVSLSRKKLVAQFPNIPEGEINRIMKLPVDEQKKILTKLMSGQKIHPKFTQQQYLEDLDKRIMDEMDITKSEMDNMSSTALDDLRRNADPIGMEQNLGEITPGRGVGDFADDPNFLRDVTPVKKVKKDRTMDDLVEQAYDEIAGGSGFSGDIKYDADILASEIATTGGKIYDDLADVERMGIYDLAYKRMAKNLKLKMDFKKDLKDVHQKIELQMFDTKGKKPHAEGGRIGYAVGKLVKGGKWFLKNLKKAYDEIIEGKGAYSKLDSMQREDLKWQVLAQLKQVERGGPIPDEAIKMIRQDPKFANVSKTRSTDPDLYEFEDVVLNYGKKGDVVDEQVKILEEFTPTGKGNAEGGRIGMMYGGDPGFAFEYGGSWADWHDQHRNTMPVEQYIQTKLPKDRLPFRQDMIFGGSAGLRALLKRLRGTRKRVFPSPPQGIKKFMRKGDMDYIDSLKLQQLETILKAAKIDKETLAHSYKVKKMNDPGLDFLMGKLEESGLKAKNLDKYTNIDKDIMDIEMMIKSYMEKKLKRRPHESGGLAYMLGEPTYSIGGSVGHAPWHKPTGQPQQQQQLDTPSPQVGGAQSPGRGQPNPMKAPRGLPSLAPRTMDPAFMQQQMMQKAMMGRGPGNTGQGPRPMANQGGRIGFGEGTQEEFNRFLKEREQMHREGGKQNILRDWERYKRFKKYGKGAVQEAAEGGRIGFKLGSINKGRRAFMKWLAGIMGTGVAAGTGLFKLGKVAPKVIKEAEVITRGAAGMPTYITDLIEVVKAKGTRDFIEGFKRSDYSTVHSYKGVDVIEDAAGNTRIKKGQEKPMYGSDEPSYHEIEMEIRKGDYVKNKKGKMVKEGDEYVEYTAKPDMDGKLKDVEEYIDDMDHLELKEIADEAKDLLKLKKASGGLAYMLGE